MQFIAYVIIAIVCWGIAPLLEKQGLKRLSPAEGVFVRSMAVLLCLIVFFIISRQYQGLHHLDVKAVLFLAAAGIISAGFGQMAYFAALKVGRPSVLVPMVASYPLVTVLLSTIITGDKITPMRVFGALMVIGGVVLTKMSE